MGGGLDYVVNKPSSVDLVCACMRACVFQPLLHTLQACTLIKAQDEKKIQLLYEFLANASKVYFDVFPLM